MSTDNEWRGIQWYGDTHYGHCSACGKPATRGADGWWHCYATHVIACLEVTATFVEDGEFPAGPGPESETT